jgi:GTP-binding protein LepA
MDKWSWQRERGITIKARAVGLSYTAANGETYTLNLIDTPGHVDFNYEVSRSLAACEGALLVVDARQGVEAQTLANTYLALDSNLEILPVINKIDLVGADPAKVKAEIEDVIGIPAMDAPEISAKLGINIDAVLEDIIANVPPPRGDASAPLRALIFDSQFDSYVGVIVYIRLMDGYIPDCPASMMSIAIQGIDVARALKLSPALSLRGRPYFTSASNVAHLPRTLHVQSSVKTSRPTAGFSRISSDGRFPLRVLTSLMRYDAACRRPEASRVGFLRWAFWYSEWIIRKGMGYRLDLITTAPSVIYKVVKTNGEISTIDNPLNYPDPSLIEHAEEPFVAASIMTPQEYVGNIMELCQERRGEYKDMIYQGSDRVELHYHLPLNEIIYDFFDALKSRTKGYASLDYTLESYRPSELVKLDILLNGEAVDALSFIVHKDKAYERGRRIAEKLKDNIPRQMFEIPVQAAIGGKVIARETIKALRKDVLAKCYGGDITRKKKLLEKQKEGKKRMRSLGTVSVPQEAFMAVLKLDE